MRSVFVLWRVSRSREGGERKCAFSRTRHVPTKYKHRSNASQHWDGWRGLLVRLG